MGTIIIWILRLLGRDLVLAKHLSSVSKTIASLPVPENQRWFWGGFVHLVPVAIGLTVLFVSRAPYYQYGLAERAALLLTGSWGWIGPWLIWRYENRTLPTFVLRCDEVIRDRASLENIQNRVYSNVFRDPVCVIISMLWITVTVAGFLWVSPFVDGFGIHGRKDWLWIIMLAGVMLYGYYSSLGFCFVYKTILLTRMVVVSDIEADVFSKDGVFGFSFIGDFALETSLMFLSGIVFIPLLFMITQQVGSNEYFVPLTLVGTYMVAVITSFVYPIYNVHNKIIQEKEKVLKKCLERANEIGRELEIKFVQIKFSAWSYNREIAKDVKETGEWPLRVDTFGRFVLSAIVAPIVVTLLARLLTDR